MGLSSSRTSRAAGGDADGIETAERDMQAGYACYKHASNHFDTPCVNLRLLGICRQIAEPVAV